MSDFRQIQNGPARRFARPRSIAGRQSGTMSMAQYTAQQASKNLAREPKSAEEKLTKQPLFRPPSSLNHLFPCEIDDASETKSAPNSKITQNLIGLTASQEDGGNSRQHDPSCSDVHSTTGGSAPQRSAPAIATPHLPKPSPRPQPCATSLGSLLADAESEAWLKQQLSQQEEKKKHTRFVDWPPPTRQSGPFPTSVEIPPAKISPVKATPVKSSPNLPGADNIRQFNRWIPSNKRTPHCLAPIDKDYAKGIKQVEATGKALERFSKSGDITPRVQTEIMEYEQCKSKTDRKMTLNATERKRLGDIVRNIERREYAMSVEKLVERQQDTQERPSKKGQKSGSTKAKDPLVREEVESTFSFSSPLSLPPAQVQPARDDIPKARAANPQNIKEEYQSSSSDGDCESEEEEGVLKQTNSAPEQLWLYNVYRSDSGYSQAAGVTTFVSSHFSKSKAEDVMRQAIRSCYGSITERTRIEFRAIIEENFQEQVVELASGQCTAVRVERELVEEETPRKKRRKKLHSLPTRLYTVVERVLVLTSESHSSPNGSLSDSACSVLSGTTRERNDGCSYRQLPECFVLPSDANAAASKLMMSHLTAHLQDEEKFDLDITGGMDMDARQYLHELESGERLYDKEQTLPMGKDGRTKVSIQVIEQLVRGPRN